MKKVIAFVLCALTVISACAFSLNVSAGKASGEAGGLYA